ncbi:MAG: hypothetical protein RLO81_10735 [Fulvivirga sp.]|uniref:hypothetical protein n=1 Tax=Fulvivirga sp. TaxID=1931237 RepID=UPI0032EACC02
MRHKKKIKKIALMILIIPIVIVAFVFVVMSLWNWLIPDLFNGPVLDFWQTLGLIILSKILFGGFKGGRSHKPHGGEWGAGWKKRFKEMTPEERVAFKEKWRNKWNCKHHSATKEEATKVVE